MAEVGAFPLLDGDHEIAIYLRSNAGNQVMHGGHAIRREEADSSNGLQVSCDLFKSVIQFSNGPVNVGFYRHEFGGFIVRAVALWLRQRDGAFNFVASHVALLGNLVRAAFGGQNTGRRLLGFWFGLLLFWFARLVWHSRPRLCFLFLPKF
jgi:hypothetical protein